MATQQTPHRQPAAFESTMTHHRLTGIFGTTGKKSAASGQEGRHQKLIGTNQTKQYHFHSGLINEANNFCKSRRNASDVAPPACGLAINTKSSPSANSGRFRRKNSRICRLTRVRTTALPTLRLTVRPSRALEHTVAKAKSRKKRPPILRPAAVTERKSVPSNRRADLGNRSSRCGVAPSSRPFGVVDGNRSKTPEA